MKKIFAEFFRVVEGIDSSILSQLTGIEYPIHVHVPTGYESTTKNYPVIYTTDGQWYSDSFSAEIKKQGKEVILVAIEQGPDNRRATDYPLPGAKTYYQFLVTELIPLVERFYRADPQERSIVGASYGGLLVANVLFMDNVDTPVFNKYLCFDGSFWTNRSSLKILEDQRFALSQKMNVTLFLSSALYQGNDYWVTVFENRLKARGYSGLTIYRRSYSVVHNDVGDPSFATALRLLY